MTRNIMIKPDDEFLEKTTSDIENFTLKPIKRKSGGQTFVFRSSKHLFTNIIGEIGTAFVRSILAQLQINEHHIFRWRLENKYMQYLILNHYAPHCMPKTMGFSQLLEETDGISKIRKLLSRNFFIKSTLGDGSGEKNTFDRTSEFENILLEYQQEKEQVQDNFAMYHHSQKKILPVQEKWILQKKMNFKNEFRVHTFQRDVIDGLTFERYGLNLFYQHPQAEEFVRSILERLPDTILHGALIGWDVGLTYNNKYYVIEANFTGFHPEYDFGFQTSGYFQDNNFGPVCCCRLNDYFKHNYHIAVSSIAVSLQQESLFLQTVMFYLTKPEQAVVFHKKPAVSVSALIYLDKEPEELESTLTDYFQKIAFISTYYLIVKEEFFQHTTDLFGKWAPIKIIAEKELYTPEQYQFIRTLNQERQQQICYLHACQLLHENYCFFIPFPSIVLKKLRISDLFIQNKPINFKYLELNESGFNDAASRYLQMKSTNYRYDLHSLYASAVLRNLYHYLFYYYKDAIISTLSSDPKIEFAALYYIFLENLNRYNVIYCQASDFTRSVYHLDELKQAAHRPYEQDVYFVKLIS